MTRRGRRAAGGRRRRRPRSGHLPVPARAGAGRGVEHPADDHHPSRPDGRPRPVVVGLGDQRRRDASGASPRCRPSRRWTPARSGRPAPSRCPATPPRKSALYNGPGDRRRHRADPRGGGEGRRPDVRPRTVGLRRADVRGRLRPTMRQADREFSWSDPTAHDPAPDPRRRRVARRAHDARAASRCRCSTPMRTARSRWPASRARSPLRRHGAVLVRTGDGAVWIGQVRRVRLDGGRA